MEVTTKTKLREFLINMLIEHKGQGNILDDESIFMSGLLDSFSMMNVVMYLEKTYGFDFSKVEFDVSFLDTVNDIEKFIDSNQKM